jgi:PIN domain nuclease of toxin-antitoxin system
MYLIDTHTLLWWASNDSRLSARVLELLAEQDNAVFCSAVSVWEVSIKSAKGKLQIPMHPVQFFAKLLEYYNFSTLPILLSHAACLYDLPHLHSDPFDRLLIAQAKEEQLTIITDDSAIKDYDIKTFW